MPQYTLEELLERFRASDPDYFEDFNDADLTSFILEQYPSYRQNVIEEELPEEYPVITKDAPEKFDPSIGQGMKKLAYNFADRIGALENTLSTVAETYVKNNIRKEDDFFYSHYGGMSGAMDPYMVAENMGLARDDVVLDANSGTWFNKQDGTALPGTDRPLTTYEKEREAAFTEGSKRLEAERQKHMEDMAEWAKDPDIAAYIK